MKQTFARTELAQTMAHTLFNEDVGSAVSSGLFLAAPRRPGAPARARSYAKICGQPWSPVARWSSTRTSGPTERRILAK